MRLRIGLVGLLLLWVGRDPVAAALLVEVFGAGGATSITAVQTTISAVQSVIHTAKWIIDQTPLNELAMGDEWAEDMAQMTRLVQEAQARAMTSGP